MSIDSAFAAGDTVKFAEVGDAVTLEVTSVDEVDGHDFDGNPKISIVISGRDDTGTDRRLFCDKKQLLHAIGTAVKEAGGKGAPEAGGKLHVVRTEDGTPSKVGYQPPHGYRAKYQPPAPGAATSGVNEAFDEDPF